MSYGVVSWRETFGTVTVEAQEDGGPLETATFSGVAWGFRLAGASSFGAGSMPAAVDAAIGTLPNVSTVADQQWIGLGGGIRWGLSAESTGADWQVFRLVFPDLAVARQYGFSATTANATLAGDLATLASDFSPAGLWNGGCNRFVEDEPDTLHRVEVSQSPYTIGANTHVRLGHRDRRTGRWVQVHGAYIHRLLAEDSRFTDVANRNPNNPNNLLDRLVRVASEGAELYYTPQGRPEVRVQIVDADPRVSQYASRVGQSGRRYDVQIGMEVIA